jgi:hypothetical protein
LAKKKPIAPGARGANPPPPPPPPPVVGGTASAATPLRKYRHGGRTLAERRTAKIGAMRSSGMARLRNLGIIAAGLGAGAVGTGKLVGDYRDTLLFNAINDIQANRASLRQNEMMRQARQASYQDAIDRNLGRLAQSAPDLYASVSAGRKLPQGGVVIGGAPRQDLLNELGRAMSDGRFSR